MRRTLRLVTACLLFVPAAASAQVNFQKTGYYAALGDSVAAGEGAMPVTNGYAYQLYEQGVFGTKQTMDFSILAVRGGRSQDLLTHQVPQLLCSEPAQRPTIVTITAGANDLFRGDFNVPAIALRVVAAINQLLNNDNGFAVPILDPFTNAPCRRLQNVTILVSNYYQIPHPDPATAALLDQAIQGFDFVLRMGLQNINKPAGTTVRVVDLYTMSKEQQGDIVLLRGPGGFDVHPTNHGHTLIAKEFQKVWNSIQ
jgi:lysophospholipase L1-like esterase